MIREGHEIVTWYIGNMKIKLTKTSTSCRLEIFPDSHSYKETDIGTKKYFGNDNSSVCILIKSINAYRRIVESGIKTKWKNFNVKWHRLEYKNVPPKICFKVSDEDLDLEISIHKRKFIPKDWSGSYTHYINRKKQELVDIKRVGYVNNRHRADYSHNNIRNPFSGGVVRPK